jgi:hypothetical protein
MTTDNKLSLLLDNQVPDYVKEYYPLFVVFVTKYFEWLDTGGQPQQVLQSLRLNRDIDTVVSSLTTKFYAQYIPNLPQNYAADPAILVKYFRDFYEAKGTENSFKFFFRAFFDDDITISRPRESVFKTSDSVWIQQQYLRVSADIGRPEQLLGSFITGSSTGARGAVNQVIQVAAGRYYDLLMLKDTVTGTFSSSETVTGYYFDTGLDTSVAITVTNTLPLQTAPGRSLDSRSQLSSDQILQDSFFYQNFSYVVRSRVNLDQWRQAILSQLHPTGHAFFNERVVDGIPLSVTSNFIRSTQINTTVTFAEDRDFYIAAGYAFDRLADFRTGTSATTSAGAIVYDPGFAYQGENVTFALQKGGDNTIFGDREITGSTSYLTSFTTTTFTDTEDTPATVTSVVHLAYTINIDEGVGLDEQLDASNVTDPVGDYGDQTTSLTVTDSTLAITASQSQSSSIWSTSYFVDANSFANHAEDFFFDGDLTTSVVTFFGFSRTEIVGAGPTFDKVGAGVSVNEQIVLDGLGVDSSLVTQYFHSETSLTLSANTVVITGSIFDATSCLLIVTWMKDPSGNATNEINNALTISVSSTAGIYVLFNEELQRNYRSLALGDSLFYPKLTYYNSSNTLVNTAGDQHGDEITGGTATSFDFVPFNVNRSQSYSRAVIRIDQVGLGNTTDFSVKVKSGASFNALAEDHLNIVVVGAAP